MAVTRDRKTGADAPTATQKYKAQVGALADAAASTFRHSVEIRTPTLGAYRRGKVQPPPPIAEQPIPTSLEFKAAELELTHRYGRIDDYRQMLEDRARAASRTESVSFQSRIDIPLAVSEIKFRRNLVTSAFLTLGQMGNLQRLDTLEKAYDSAGADSSRKHRTDLVAKALTDLGVRHGREELRRYTTAFNHLEEEHLPYHIRRIAARQMVETLPHIQ